ncbi:MAG: DNA topoisomerase I, partial [Actinobacteria bacterium]|nr:DNA topoisomerase I [Actinomycetota bacterium]
MRRILQQVRRILDRLVGYKLSPLVSKAVGKPDASAGRVQSVALRMVVERDREIEAFNPAEYWTVDGYFTRPDATAPLLRARLVTDGEDLTVASQTASDQLVALLHTARYRVEAVRPQLREQRPSPPFTTSSLQQAASSRLGFSPRRTMALAQQLYEGIDTDEGRVGLITYMRTDSTQVAAQAQREARAWITGAYAAEYVPPSPPVYSSHAKNAQEAHEAIRPTAVHRTPDSVRSRLDEAQQRLYELIWRRFVASQMAPARLRRHAADLRAAVGADDLPHRFRATATRTLFPGYLVVAQDENAPD